MIKYFNIAVVATAVIATMIVLVGCPASTPKTPDPTPPAPFATGVAVRVGSQNNFNVGESDPSGIALLGGTFYMVGTKNDALYTLNITTGVATRVGTVTEFGAVSEDLPVGLAALGNKLYMVGEENDALYTLNITTGVATRVGNVGQFGVGEPKPAGLAAIEGAPGSLGLINGRLYMVGRQNNALYTLNTTTGRATQVRTAAGDGTKGGPVLQYTPTGIAVIDTTIYMVGEAMSANAGVTALYTLTVDITSGNITMHNATRLGTATNFGSVNEGKPRGLVALNGNLYMLGATNGALYRFQR